MTANSQPLLNKGFSPLAQVAVFLGVWGLAFIAASLVSVLMLSSAGIPLKGFNEALKNPAHAPTIKLLQAVSTLLIFGLPAVAYGFICFRNGWQAVGFGSNFSWKLALIASLLILASGPLIDALNTLNKAIPVGASLRKYFDQMEQNYASQVQVLVNVKSPGQLLLSLVMIAALPAIFEELMFRGGLQGLLTRWWRSPWVAIVVTSLIFSAIHGSWYGFIPRLVLGIFLGAVFYFTANLWYSILMHFINNALALLVMYYFSLQGKPLPVGEGFTLPVWTGIFSLAAVVLLLMWLRRETQPAIPQEIWRQRNNPFEV